MKAYGQKIARKGNPITTTYATIKTMILANTAGIVINRIDKTLLFTY